MRRARIFGAIDAVPEARNLLFSGELRADHILDLLVGDVLPEFEQHVHDVGIGAAVQRALERADAAGNGGMHVGQRGGRDTSNEG